MEDLFLGVDMGTSAMKIVLIDGKKNILKQINEAYSPSRPNPGWREIDPEIWFNSMITGVKKLLSNDERGCIRGIGVTGQMHTLIVLDSDGKPIRPAIMWNDTRTKDSIPEMKEIMSGFEEGHYLSKTVSIGSPAANLLWLKTNEPDNFKRIRKFLIGPDYLVYRLTGNMSTDFCEASTSCLFKIREKCWSQEMRDYIGLDKSIYPDIRGSMCSAGSITDEAAGILSLNNDVRVVVGTGDNPATAISTGCLAKGYPVLSLGTSGVLMMPLEEINEDAKGKVILFSFDGNRYLYLVQGTVQSNGSTVDWWVKNIMGDSDYTSIDKVPDFKKAAGNKVLFYPHLMGDKTLYADPDIRGAFVGLSTENDRDDLMYSVLEGICFSIRQLGEEMHLPIWDYGSVRVVGGGAKSSAWMQILANVLNVRVERMAGMTGPAYGIALLSAEEHNGGFVPDKIVDKADENAVSFEPDPELSRLCDLKYQKYLRMRKGLKYIEDGTEI